MTPTAPAEADAAGAADGEPLVVPLAALQRGQLALAGGKAANLGELLRAGLPAPDGFCVTTAAYARATAGAGIGAALDALAGVAADDLTRQATIAAGLRQAIVAAPVPADVERAVRRALGAAGAGAGGADEPAWAVRSSATAEDLPFASFAGQQDTYLNIRGPEAVLDAVRRCWASLWTDRAVTYRARAGIDPHGVRLAVVVQRLVDAAVAGVLFTADPLTGRRRRAVIDASPGLGEAVVSGAVNPDHFVVDTAAGTVLERRLGDKRLAVRPAPEGGTQRADVAPRPDAPCLSDRQLAELARMGARVEALFGSPQDLEFAVDGGGVLWLTQARPITTLFPLPASAPADDRELRVYFNFNVAQGVFRPLTPAGQQAFRAIAGGVATLLGFPPADPLAGPPFVQEAAGRLFFDVTGLIRSAAGRRAGAAMLERAEARSGVLLRSLFADPRLAVRPGVERRVAPVAVRTLARTRLPLYVLRALAVPGLAQRRARGLQVPLIAESTLPASAGAEERLALAATLLLTWPGRLVPQAMALLVAGLGALALAWRLLGERVSAEERDTVTRALPHNPTTEMDLELWALAGRARADAAAAAALRAGAPDVLAAAFRRGRLPEVLQSGLAAFLARYGHRAVAEIDLGLPRWGDDPAHLLGVLTNYLSLDDPSLGPDVQFRRAATRADALVAELAGRAGADGRLRGAVVRFLLGRGRALAGGRERPKYLVVLLLARVRQILAPIGFDLVAAGALDAPDDLWFLSLPEMRAALPPGSRDLRPLVRERRAQYEEELKRRHLPRLLLSDGTEPAAGAAAPAAGGADGAALRGTPASAGLVTGPARVILDPVGARLAPGEILVAPSTDPGWTPLFLTAGGLVMEMGGAMSHGAVVAREYGIPAVVGVAGATERIADGRRLTVDGTNGTVTEAPPATGAGEAGSAPPATAGAPRGG
jgi:pyruvate,water dikinase